MTTSVRKYAAPSVGDVVLFGVYAGTDEHGKDVIQQCPAIVVISSPESYPLPGYELLLSELAVLYNGQVTFYYRAEFSEHPRCNYWSFKPGAEK